MNPTRVLFVNGFLGAGKTTALVSLARLLRGDGRRVAFITNDQAHELVDTARARGVAELVAEVAGGCFCCRFSDLTEAADRLLAHRPDYLLCEAVGSCTDVVATVLRPFARFYGDDVSVAPLSVLFDPLQPKPASDDIAYLQAKQLEEADLVVVNKIDLVRDRDLPRFRRSVAISALHSIGLREWLAALDAPAGAFALHDLDYDTYARAEAELAWLNATATVVNADIDALTAKLRGECDARGMPFAHVKLAADGARLTINIRAATSPEELLAAVRAIVALDEGARAFRPAYPVPQVRMS